MSDSDLIDSKVDICGATTSLNGNLLSSRTPPNCARCKNHGLKIILKGHKRYCKYKCCNCEKCRLTSDRQKIMALQTSWRRAQAQDEARGLLVGEVPPIAPVSSFLHHHLHHHHSNHHNHTTKIPPEHRTDNLEPAPVLQPSLEGSCDSSSLPSSASGATPSTLIRKLTPIPANGAHLPFGQSAEVFLEYCQKLLEKFCYPWEMMPLMYVILKDAKADIEEASRRIDEAQQFINLTYPLGSLRYSAQVAPFAPMTYLPIPPIYLGRNGFICSQICSASTTRHSTPEPAPKHRNRSLSVSLKSKNENITVETSST